MKKYQKYLINKSVVVGNLLEKLFEKLDKLTDGDYIIEEKNDSLHIVKGSAFLGVHFLKEVLRLNIVLDHEIDTDLPRKLDKPSKNVFHNKVDLANIEDLEKVVPFIREAYELKNK